MRAEDVMPQKWQQEPLYPIRILYDDDEYSVIFGKYIDEKAVGVRWNGQEDKGFPSQGANPTWYIEPDFIAISILHRLQTLALDSGDITYLDNIKIAISELNDKIQNNKKP